VPKLPVQHNADMKAEDVFRATTSVVTQVL